MTPRPSSFAYGLAALLPIGAAALLVGLRDDLDPANLALCLVVVVVVAAAAGGRGPATVAALVSSVSYTFFLTAPYYSLRVDDSDDIETALILLAIGLLVGQVAAVARAREAAVERGRDELAVLRRFAARAAGDATAVELTTAATAELTALLGLLSCRFEWSPTGPVLPFLERSGHIDAPVKTLVDGEFALPAIGVRLPVAGRGKELGSIAMDPDPTRGVSVEERLVAVALADQLGAALASRSSMR